MNAIARLACGILLCGFAGSALADKAPPRLKEGVFDVDDDAKLFSPEAIRKAKDTFAEVKSHTGREVTLRTMNELPAAEKAEFGKLTKDDTAGQRKFWSKYARTLAKEDHGKGVFVLITRLPGHVHVLVDEEMTRKGFSERKAEAVQEALLAAMRSAAPEKAKEPAEQRTTRDKALLAMVDYLAKNLPEASTDLKAGTKPTANATDEGAEEKKGGWNIGSILCIGISVLLGIWLVTALVRAFSGGGGGGGMGGGGMGGGGFFPSLLGGLFGAAAGMFLYDQFFGDSSSAHAGDGGSSGDAGGGGVDDAGGGNWDSGGDTGGDFGGGGDVGGGDFGGGDF